MKKVTRLTEGDLTRIVRRVINEGEGFKSNKKEDADLELRRKLDAIFFGKDEYNIFSEPGEFGYLSSEHSLDRKVSPRQRQERIRQIIDLLKSYIKDLEYSADNADPYSQNPDYKDVWGKIEGEDDDI